MGTMYQSGKVIFPYPGLYQKPPRGRGPMKRARITRKNRRNVTVPRVALWWTAVFMVLVSCTTRGPPVSAPPVVTGTLRIEEPVLPPPPLPPLPAPEFERVMTIDEAVRQIKVNSPEIVKSVTPGPVDDITVTGDIQGYRVVYDLRNALPQDGRGFLVAFSVEDPLRGEKREDSLLWQAEEDNAGVLLSMDDDYQDDWEAYFDCFDRHGAKITFFVQGEMCHFCREARSRGHDIGYHTLRHLNLTKVSEEVFRSETLGALSDFRRAGIPLGSFAYPYGLSEPWMHEALSPFFGLQRGYGVRFQTYRGQAIDRYIASTAIDNILFKEDGAFERALFLMLLTTKFLGKDHVASFTTHDISDTAQWGIKPARLEYLLKTIQDFNLKFYLFSDFAKTALSAAP
jgi:peptidoglycan/xylan/chitin deacetylase (PgdA/CDA1 family)